MRSIRTLWVLVGLITAGVSFWWTQGMISDSKQASSEASQCAHCRASGHDQIWENHDDLGWLASEYGLNEKEMEDILRVHQAFIPECERRCELMSQAYHEFMSALSKGGSPSLEQNVEARDALKRYMDQSSQCQWAAVEHVLKTSALMNPVAAQKYQKHVFEYLLPRHHMISSYQEASLESSGVDLHVTGDGAMGQDHE